MSYNHTLRYRTFDSLLADVANDFKKYQLKDLIDPSDTIKVARRVNYDLGLRINQTKEFVLEIEKGKAKLPNDFYILNFALACGKYEAKVYYPQGTHVEEKIIGKVAPEYQEAPPETIDTCSDMVDPASTEDPCNPEPGKCQLSCNGDVYKLVQNVTYETRTYTSLMPIRMINNPREIDCDCPNLYWDSSITGYIKDGWFYTSFETGTVYINYQGNLEDNEGNLLVVDHDVINEYYEYALKQRIIENLIMNDEEVNPNKIQLIEQRYRAARNNALSIVNMPNFAELKQLYQANRNAQYSKYYDMFSSYPRVYNRR